MALFNAYLGVVAIAVHLKMSHAAFAALQNFTVIDFLSDVKRLHGYDNVLVMQNYNASIARPFMHVVTPPNDSVNASAVNVAAEAVHFYSRIMLELQVPVLQMNEKATFYLKRHITDALMSLVYLDGTMADHNGLLKQLVMNLRHMTVSKIMFLLNYPAVNVILLEQLFQFCWQNKMINVVAMFADYQHTATFYSYTHFPEFALETKRIYVDLINRRDIYPYRLGNLKGYKLPYIIGGADPRIIVYLKPDSTMFIGGFAGHFLQTFAEKYNCQLYEPIPAKINAFAPSQDLIKAVRNGTVEISAALTFPSIPFIGFTYPYEQMNWCLMLPVEPDVPGYEFYIITFKWDGFAVTIVTLITLSLVLSTTLLRKGYKPHIINFFVHADCLRGALGQPFTEIRHPPRVVRFLYIQICLMGIMLTTWYNAYFSSYITSAPKLPPFRSFDDILYSSHKVFVYGPEYNELVGRVADFRKYSPMFYIENNFQHYLLKRDSFSTEYIYMVPTPKWTIINEQQKVFSTPIFRHRDDLCFYHNIPMCFPVHENSIYMQTIYAHVLEVSQAGLYAFWTQTGFLEMIAAGKLSFADLSQKSEFTAMIVSDLQYIWWGFAFMAVVSSLVFVWENCYFRRELIFKFLKGCLRRFGGGGQPVM